MCSYRKLATAAIAFILAAPLATAAFAESKATIVDPVAAVSDKRVALVIGNASYGQKSSGISVPNLVNPLNDARAIRDTLTKLGFRVVYGENLTKKELEHAIGTFASVVEGADVAITYFSGHGSTFGDVPYLVPVDAEFESLEAIPYELIKVEDFIGELRRAKGVRIALIDACRDNGADQALKSASKTKGVGQTKGLARVANPDGLIIVYATQFLTTAQDGDAANSPFAAALMQHLPTPGEDVKNVLFDVANDVVRRTKGEQRPEVSVSLFDSFALNPGVATATPQIPTVSSAPILSPRPADEAAWQRIATSADPVDFESFARVFPDSAHKAEADAKAKSLRPTAGPKVGALQPTPSPKPVPAPTPACEGGLVASVGNAGVAAAAERCLKPKDVFRDCENCPEMVVIPAGSFTMGSPSSEKDHLDTEGPQHGVRIGAPFAVGKFEITRGQFAAFVNDTGYKPRDSCWILVKDKWVDTKGRSFRDPGFEQDDSHPAVCTSWDDAKAYVAWLAKTTGKGYRLLSEAEYEYAERAGTTTTFSFGNDPNELCGYANGADRTAKAQFPTFPTWTTTADCKDGYVYTAPVGSFAANDFGLYDMVGNVWEWVEDCSHDSYAGAPNDGSAWTTGSCEYRAIRGGAWGNEPRLLRAANRNRELPDVRGVTGGFRVARTL